MPYNTRNRSNTDPVPQLRPQKLQQLLRPPFPPPGLKLHPDDEGSKVLHALVNALLAVNNRAMTIKDLAESALRHGLACSGTSPLNAASQQITSYIRLHQRRCEDGLSKPLLKAHTLTGTSDDDRLTPALYSRAGGTATRKGGAVDTAFRKGTLVWYLSPETGAPDPFQIAGIKLPGAKKRRRRIKTSVNSSDSEEEQRPKIKLKIKLGSLSVARATADITPPSPPSPTGSSETAPIILDSPPSSPTMSTCPLRLPPYPIQSHTRHLRDIPNSPYDLPEYASPPPDSEDDFDDFHTSMMAGVNHSDSEADIKDEFESDLEGSDGRRSRSTSWTTVTDPKTPRDVDRPLNHPALKLEGYDDLAETSTRWDSLSPESGLPIKREEGVSDLNETWTAQDDAESSLSLDMDGFTFMPLISKTEGPDDENTPAHGYHIGRSRSFSAPAAWQSKSLATTRTIDCVAEEEDELEILGPDSVPPEEFDRCFWTRRDVTSANPLPGSSHLAEKIQTPHSESAETGAIPTTVIDGTKLYELRVNSHVLWRRVDDGRVHWTSLAGLLSKLSPTTNFMHLDDASHVKEGDLKGTWIPSSLVRNVVKDQYLLPDIARFLEDPPLEPQLDTLPPHIPDSEFVKADAPRDIPTLLPPFEFNPPTQTRPSITIEERPPTSPFPERTKLVYDDKLLTWQENELADWKLRMDLDSNITFPRSAYVPSLQSTELPLSPQEEEIFHSLVDLGMGKSVDREREREEQAEEDVLEADDEHEDSPMQLRRSKRVAARSGTTRTKGSQPVSRRRPTRAR